MPIPQFLLVWVDVHSFVEVLVPLASDVVRNIEHKDFSTMKLLPEDIVNVEVPAERLSKGVEYSQESPYFSPSCISPSLRRYIFI